MCMGGAVGGQVHQRTVFASIEKHCNAVSVSTATFALVVEIYDLQLKLLHCSLPSLRFALQSCLYIPENELDEKKQSLG